MHMDEAGASCLQIGPGTLRWRLGGEGGAWGMQMGAGAHGRWVGPVGRGQGTSIGMGT